MLPFGKQQDFWVFLFDDKFRSDQRGSRRAAEAKECSDRAASEAQRLRHISGT
jgi:hypothetical protein